MREVGVKLGIRGRLFALCLGAIAIAVTLLNSYMSAELRSAIENRMAEDLDVRAQLIARQIESAPPSTDWQGLAEELGRRALARITIVATDGTVLGDSEVPRSDLPGVANHAGRPEIVQALKTGHGSATRRSATVHHDFLYVAVPVASSPVRVIRLAQSLEVSEKAVSRAQRLMWIATLFALAIAAILSSAGSHYVSKSIRTLRTTAVAMLDDLSVRTRMRAGDEVGALAEALDRLADSLHRTVQNLASERDRLAGILETMAEGVLLTDPNGRIVLANSSLRSMVAASGQLIGKEPIEAIRNDELAELINTVAKRQRPSTGEVDLIGIVPRRVLVRAAPLTVKGNHGVVAVLSDVTELRRLESLRRDFVANVSHELRTPIAAIRAAAETLEGGVDDDVMARDFVGMISRHADRLHQLVEDLLHLSRIEAQKLDLKPTVIDVAELLDHMIGLYALSASRHGIHLVAGRCPRGLTVTADRRALEQILSNLVDNAIKYASAGAAVTLSAVAQEGEIALAVADTGTGIAAKHLPRLFERFYRVDRGRARDVGGTGLGLSIVKHLTEALGGHVMVESLPGVGSTFTIHLPAKATVETPATTESRSDDAGLPHQP
jgi:two-component system phosphate regulon sensor histidine kinase PhoR